jgi:hypothetical protein
MTARLTSLALWRVMMLAIVTALTAWSLWVSVRNASLAGIVIFGITLVIIGGTLIWIIALKVHAIDPTDTTESSTPTG